MKTAYFDCFAGVSGDMTLGALLDLGVDQDWFKSELAKLPEIEFDIYIRKVSKLGIQATDIHVALIEEHHHRRLKDVSRIITASGISESAKKRALDVFVMLAEAESKIHGTTPEEVHFHEVGAVDAIVDIVGASILIENLGIEQIISSPLPMSHGFVKAAHGNIPLPAPATLEILKGVPVYDSRVEGEMVTPTGAAILRALADSFGEMPTMVVSAIGYGSGKTDFDFPNVLRVLIGEADIAPKETVRVSVIETNIDDMNPEFYDSIFEKLFQAGAFDVYTAPIQMKKNRPATLLCAICPTDKTDDVARAILTETTSFGVRITTADRRCLERSWETVSTRYGDIRIKVGKLPGGQVTASPEYEDCRKAAEEHNVPIKRVYEESIARYYS